MRTTLLAWLALFAAGCAHNHDLAAHTHPATTDVREGLVPDHDSSPAAAPTADPAPAPLARPEDAYRRRNAWGRREMASDQVVTIPYVERGIPLADLFDFVVGETGVRIRYETHNQVIKNKVVTMAGPRQLPKGDLLAWMQDSCIFVGLLVAPYGPPDRKEYATFDVGNWALANHAQFVSEDELPALAGRAGLYVTCILTIPDGLALGRARQALSQLSTKTAGLGRILDFGEGAGFLAVSDFANVAANMRRILDEMAIERYEQSR